MGRTIVIHSEEESATHVSGEGNFFRLRSVSETGKVVSKHVVVELSIEELCKQYNLKPKGEIDE